MRNILISVIVPVYNCEKYLTEAIESIINQTIGFEEKVELILINDGSTDSSEAICLAYKEKYPDNIVYHSYENRGVSCARNTGIGYATGKYISFLDADDVWAVDAFEKVLDFVKVNGEEINVVCCKRMLFGKKRGEHYLNKTFNDGPRIIDILKEPQCIQIFVTGFFFNSEAIRGMLFEEELSYGEDVTFFSRAVLKEGCFATLDNAVYYWRIRDEGNSLSQQFQKTISKNLNAIERYYFGLIDLSIQKYGKVILWIQAIIADGIKNYATIKFPLSVNKKKKLQFTNIVTELYSLLDDEIVLNIQGINLSKKMYILVIKHGKSMKLLFYRNNEEIIYKNKVIGTIGNNRALKIKCIKQKGKKYIISGTIPKSIYLDDIELFVKNGEQKKEKVKLKKGKDIKSFLGDTILSELKFKYIVDEKRCLIRFSAKFDGLERPLNIILPDEYKNEFNIVLKEKRVLKIEGKKS